MIIPCIDLQGGKVVQLVQGERKALELETLENAVEMFRDFPLLHIIDLDAAKGHGDNVSLIRDLLHTIKARVGGGIRSIDKAKQMIELGAEQVIVSTAAYRGDDINQLWLRSFAREIGPERTIIAVDFRNGKVAVKGWQESLDLSVEAAIEKLQPYCAGFLCTYVDREGMMQGTDLDLFLSLRPLVRGDLIAAGGISSVQEIKTLLDHNIQVALGMAIYTGLLDKDELLRMLVPSATSNE